MESKQVQAKEPEDVSVNFTPTTPIAQVLIGMAKMCHGPQNVDIPNERLQISNLVLTFNCAFGHVHKFAFNARGSEACSLVGSIIPLATETRKKAMRPVIYGPDNRPLA